MSIINKMRPIHPGEILKEEYMVPYGLSANALAQALSIPTNRITAIINETRGITGDTAIRLAGFFGTTPEFWMNLQSAYELRSTRIPPAQMAMIHKIRAGLPQTRP